MSRVVVVAPYPPRRDGIAVYARAHAERLRGLGDQVTVISPPDGDGDLRAPFHGGRALRVAAREGRRADRILVHFQPTLFHPRRAPVAKVAASLSLLWLVLRRRRTEVLVHEADRPRWWRPDELLLAAVFRAAPVLLFHTSREQAALERDYRVRVRGRII
ncbi:MAG: hypothetical protein M3245_03260, partial [Actinomycetota bacterium]|nr:hypothetical protein [Actinomycetota bacterium]